MELFVKDLAGNVMKIVLEPIATLSNLRCEIDDWGTPPDKQRLVHNGKLLQDDTKLLTDYGIGQDAVIYLIRNGRGSGCISPCFSKAANKFPKSLLSSPNVVPDNL